MLLNGEFINRTTQKLLTDFLKKKQRHLNRENSLFNKLCINWASENELLSVFHLSKIHSNVFKCKI